MKPSGHSAWLRAAVSLGVLLLVLFFLRDKLAESVAILKNEVLWPWFIMGVLTYAGGIAILSVRLGYVFRVQEIFLSFKETFYLSFIGHFFNLFFPSAVGGDIAKAYYAYKHSGKKLESTISVILDRLMGFVALILMASVAVGILSREINDSRVNLLIHGTFVLMIFVILFFASKRFAQVFQIFSVLIPSPKWKERISALYHGIHGYKHHWGILGATLLLSFLGQCFFVTVYYWVTLSLGVHMSPWIFFILVPIIAIVSMVPSLGGLGVREAGSIYLFNRFMPTERALALSLLLDILIYGFSFAAGIVFSLKGGLKAKVIHEMEELQ